MIYLNNEFENPPICVEPERLRRQRRRESTTIELEIAGRCFPLVISLLGMEEMPNFPIFKVQVCNILLN